MPRGREAALKRLLVSVLFVLAALCLSPFSVQAQSFQWDERKSEHFAILFAPGQDVVADYYAGFVDTVYEEISALFGHRTSTPITLRLYPTLEQYYTANPLARNTPGIIAHADFRRHELVVVLPQTENQSPDEVQNNIRHELTHLVVAELSDDKLNIGFHEGIAQYVEHPSRELETRVQLLRNAINSNSLMPWSDLDNREIVYAYPNVSYPESLSIVAFLVDRYSFAKFRDFVTASASASGYRSALEQTFGKTPTELEQDWLRWLPIYVESGYRHTVIVPYDMARIDALMLQGNYALAQQELEPLIDWLRTTDQRDLLAQAQGLLQKSQQAMQAEALAQQARQALEDANYPLARELVERSEQGYRGINDLRQLPILAVYRERAERGLAALNELERAQGFANNFRYPQAQAVAQRAVSEFLILGDQQRANEAQQLYRTLDQRQMLAGYVLMIMGLGGVFATTVRRFLVREQEVW
jgi:hypothetical protein